MSSRLLPFWYDPSRDRVGSRPVSGEFLFRPGFLRIPRPATILGSLKLTVAGHRLWWRVMLPALALLGHSAAYLLVGRNHNPLTRPPNHAPSSRACGSFRPALVESPTGAGHYPPAFAGKPSRRPCAPGPYLR